MDRFLTRRAFVAGLLFSVLVALVAQFSVHVTHSSYMAIDHMPAGAIFIFFFLVFVFNTVLKSINSRLAFTSGELLLVYIMMLVASSVVEMGLGNQILPMISGPLYYTSPVNQWDTLVLPNLKRFLIVNDTEAVRYFFEGLPKGMRIPWTAWLIPLTAWLPFLLVLYFVMFCVASIFRKQWVEREKLVYPLAILPIEMVSDKKEKKGRIPPFFRNPLMWTGFSLAFLFGTIIALHFYFSLVPDIRIETTIPIFRRTMNLMFRISFPVIGFAYFVNLNVLFSLWFFNIVFKIIRGSFNIMGIASVENVGIYGCAREPIFHHFGMGAMLMMVGYSLWLARGHLKEVWQGATGKKDIDDSAEILSYKTSFWGLVFGTLFLTAWLMLSGMKWHIAVLFLVFAFIIWFIVTRVVCEGGIPTLVATSIASVQIVSMFGSSNLTPLTLGALALTYMYAADIRTFPLASTSIGLKIAEKSPERNKRMLFWAIMGALTTGILAAIIIQIQLGYRYGGINLNNWYFQGAPIAAFSYAAEMLKHQTTPNVIGWVSRSIGFLTMGIFLFMRQNFLWWPFHPIGIVVAPVWLMDELWFSIFIVWLVKSIILRYGGAKIYGKLKYFFLGLPLGLYTCAGVWFVIDLFTGKKGNQIFWI